MIVSRTTEFEPCGSISLIGAGAETRSVLASITPEPATSAVAASKARSPLRINHSLLDNNHIFVISWGNKLHIGADRQEKSRQHYDFVRFVITNLFVRATYDRQHF